MMGEKIIEKDLEYRLFFEVEGLELVVDIENSRKLGRKRYSFNL